MTDEGTQTEEATADSLTASWSDSQSGSRAASTSAPVGLIAGIRAAADQYSAVLVPVLLFTSSVVMALAWLGHLKFKQLPFALALLASWLLVLPEYLLNVSAVRIGYKHYSGAQMAAFNLSSGVVCVALVSRVVLGEALTPRKLVGFALMVVAMMLVAGGRNSRGTDPENELADAEMAGTEPPV